MINLKVLIKHIAGSSNGRTAAFEAVNSWFESKPRSYSQRGIEADRIALF